MSWFPTKAERAANAESKILGGLKVKYETKMVECGTALDGSKLTMNTVIFSPGPPVSSDSEESKNKPIPVVVAHGYGAGLGMFFRNFDSMASIPGVQLFAVDWMGMGRSSRVPFPKSTSKKADQIKKTSEKKKKKKNCFGSHPPAPSSTAPIPPTDKIEKIKTSPQKAVLVPDRAEKDFVSNRVLEKKGVANTGKSAGKDSEKKSSATHQEEKSVTISEDFFLKPFETWRKKMGIDRMVLIGHSLGGYLSAVYAMRNPERIGKLVLLSPVGVPEVPQEKQREFEERIRESRLMRTAKWLWETSTPQQLVRNLDWVGAGRMVTSSALSRRFKHLELDKETIHLITEYLYSITVLKRSGEDSLNSILKFGAWARVPLKRRMEKSLRVPTCFVYGRHDWMDPAPIRSFRKSQGLIREYVKACHIIDGGGHHMYMENPVAFNPIIVHEISTGLQQFDPKNSTESFVSTTET